MRALVYFARISALLAAMNLLSACSSRAPSVPITRHELRPSDKLESLIAGAATPADVLTAAGQAPSSSAPPEIAQIGSGMAEIQFTVISLEDTPKEWRGRVASWLEGEGIGSDHLRALNSVKGATLLTAPTVSVLEDEPSSIQIDGAPGELVLHLRFLMQIAEEGDAASILLPSLEFQVVTPRGGRIYGHVAAPLHEGVGTMLGPFNGADGAPVYLYVEGDIVGR